MTKDEIKRNAPSGATHYRFEDYDIFYYKLTPVSGDQFRVDYFSKHYNDWIYYNTGSDIKSFKPL